MNKKSLSSFVVVAIFLAATSFLLFYNGAYRKTKIENTQYVKIAGQNIKVDLALTKEMQIQGLSGRKQLKEDEGMLFVFDKPDKYYFWMKDMNFPIDMIWISEDMKVVYIKKNAQPERYLETYGPDTNTKYVLEVVAGFSDKNNLKEGDSVLFTY